MPKKRTKKSWPHNIQKLKWNRNNYQNLFIIELLHPHNSGHWIKNVELCSTTAGNLNSAFSSHSQEILKFENLKIQNFYFWMRHVKCLCWSSGHAEQLLFSCLGWKMSVYRRKWQCFFFDILLIITLSPDNTNSRAGSQLKITDY